MRNPLKLTIPERIDPIQYALRLGVIDRSTGRRLDQAGGSDELLEVGRVWVSQGRVARPSERLQVSFGEDITLLGAEFDRQQAELALYWRAKRPVAANYSVFVHLLDSAGNMLGQADGAPYANRYPTGAWRPGEIIVDRRAITAAVPDVTQIDRIAVGLYDPATGVRLPAFAADGARLAGDALLLTPALALGGPTGKDAGRGCRRLLRTDANVRQVYAVANDISGLVQHIQPFASLLNVEAREERIQSRRRIRMHCNLVDVHDQFAGVPQPSAAHTADGEAVLLRHHRALAVKRLVKHLVRGVDRALRPPVEGKREGFARFQR